VTSTLASHSAWTVRWNEGVAQMTEQEPRKAAKQAPETGAFITKIAERLGASIGASAVFGATVERPAVTVIPVARATWGFGGGGGEQDEDEGYGGGGTIASPQGYIEIKDGEARYRPIGSPFRGAALIAAGGMIVGLAVLARHTR
jgi:uncharacterized spore protein YtfJ